MEPTVANPLPPSAEPPKRRKRRVWPWIVLAVVLGLPLCALGWTGLYNVPILSTVFGTNEPIDLGVRVSDAALTSALADNPMTLNGDPATWYGMARKRYMGSVPIDDVHTSEEVTSFIAEYTGGARYARDIQVRFVPGGMEVSAFVVPVIKAPVYAKVGVVRTGPKSVSISVEKAKLGRLTVPSRYYDDIADAAAEFVNARLGEADGFRLDALEYGDNTAHLVGTLPATVEQVTGEEYTVEGRDLRSL